MSDHFGISKQFPEDGSRVKVDNVNRADTAMLDIITTKMSEKQKIYKVSDSSDKVLHKVHQHIQGQLEYTNSLVPA